MLVTGIQACALRGDAPEAEDAAQPVRAVTDTGHLVQILNSATTKKKDGLIECPNGSAF